MNIDVSHRIAILRYELNIQRHIFYRYAREELLTSIQWNSLDRAAIYQWWRCCTYREQPDTNYSHLNSS